MSFTNAEALKRAVVSAPPPAPPVDAVPTDDTIDVPVQPIAPAIAPFDFESASAGIAEAESTAEKTAVALQAAEARCATIADRIRALADRRSEIIARRQGGGAQPDDAGELALISADTDGLQALLTDANAAVTTAQAARADAQRNLHFARERLELAEAERQHVLLRQHADTLAGLLHKTVDRLSAIERTLNKSASQSWVPPQPLVDIVKRAAFGTRGGW